MFLLKSKSKATLEMQSEMQSSESWYIHRLRQPGKIIDPGQIQVGGYYLYKEKFGMVAVVKIIENTSNTGWVGFRLLIKRVLYSCSQVPKGTVIETGFCAESFKYPTAWHFEPSLTLLQSDNLSQCSTETAARLKSVL